MHGEKRHSRFFRSLVVSYIGFLIPSRPGPPALRAVCIYILVWTGTFEILEIDTIVPSGGDAERVEPARFVSGRGRDRVSAPNELKVSFSQRRVTLFHFWNISPWWLVVVDDATSGPMDGRMDGAAWHRIRGRSKGLAAKNFHHSERGNKKKSKPHRNFHF